MFCIVCIVCFAIVCLCARSGQAFLGTPVTESTSDALRTESMDFAKASDEELPLVNGDLDASGTPWHMHQCKGRSTLCLLRD